MRRAAEGGELAFKFLYHRSTHKTGTPQTLLKYRQQLGLKLLMKTAQIQKGNVVVVHG